MKNQGLWPAMECLLKRYDGPVFLRRSLMLLPGKLTLLESPGRPLPAPLSGGAEKTGRDRAAPPDRLAPVLLIRPITSHTKLGAPPLRQAQGRLSPLSS